MAKFCPNCGNQMSDNAKFCVECGSKLGDYPSGGAGIKDNIIQRSQVGAASVGSVEISPVISQHIEFKGGIVPQPQEIDNTYSEILKYFYSDPLLQFSQLQKTIIRMEPRIWDGEKYISIFKGSIIILVGAWEGAELFDRIVAYKILNELDKRGVESIVIADRYWQEVKERYYDSPYIAVGGPISNSVSNEIAEKLGLNKDTVNVGFKELGRKFVGYAWGVDVRSTLNAGKIFIESYLDNFATKIKEGKFAEKR
ncbi:MAG: zinc ribbon domain-containing protein [Candidatus Methanoperedens sp.]|nr:zinc ribbon domain-containing protein [Candidatus Methanoperedens sp.]